MSLIKGQAVAIVKVEERGAQALKLHFSDGHTSIVDFGPFLRRSQNPQTRQFLDRARFSSYAVHDGNLVWGDYDMSFAIEKLYAGSVEPCAVTAETVALAVAETGTAYGVRSGKRKRSGNRPM